MKFLIDECLHTTLCDVAHSAGYVADHLYYIGMGGFKDRSLMTFILDHDYTFVTNNRSHFLALYSRTSLHAGLILIVPNVVPEQQRQFFRFALKGVREFHLKDLINQVIELDYYLGEIRGSQYAFPRAH